MRMVEALVQADKDFEWMIYPDKKHGIRGGNTRKHLYRKMTNFINNTIGNDNAVTSNTVSENEEAVLPKSSNASDSMRIELSQEVKVEGLEDAEDTKKKMPSKEVVKGNAEDAVKKVMTKEEKKAIKAGQKLKKKQARDAKKKKNN